MDLKQDATDILTADDLDYSDNRKLPEVRAASNPDSRILKALLSNSPPRRYKYDANSFIPAHTDHAFHIPLIEAIKAQLLVNVMTLLNYNANPDRYSINAVYEYAAKLWRFTGNNAGGVWPLKAIISRIRTIGKQNIPVTDGEIIERKQHYCAFWEGFDSPFPEVYRGGEGVTALEEASKHHSSEILEMIINAKPPPDTSFWTSSQQEIPEPLSLASGSSYYSASNPLICAIKNRQKHHLVRLLDLGFNPNSMPLACRQHYFSPLMAAILYYSPPNWEAINILVSHPSINTDLLTPIMRIHIIHLATALLSVSDLNRILHLPLTDFTLSKIMPTAAGHTLLHIACSPLNMTYVNIFSKRIYFSAREFRHIPFVSSAHSQSAKLEKYIIFEGDLPVPQPTYFFAAQKELVLYLLANIED